MKEADFVRWLTAAFPFSRGTGIGDDTSVVPGPSGYQLITKDILVENVHFRRQDFTLEDLALKSLAVNLSDIAAMGGTPQYFYLGLGFPANLGEEALKRFFQGLQQGCRKWQVELAGGDYSASPLLMISITVVGTTDNPIYRHNAQKDDLIAISAPIGQSALGLHLLLKGVQTHPFIDKHKHVEPEIVKGKILAPYVHAMIDISDGLSIDLQRILTASQTGGCIHYEKIPVSNEFLETCRLYDCNPHEIILAGGEDYVLLFTLTRERHLRLKKDHPGLEYHIIGEVTEAGVLDIRHHGQPIILNSPGYDHFQ